MSLLLIFCEANGALFSSFIIRKLFSCYFLSLFQTIWKIIQFCKDFTNDKLLIRSDWFHLNFAIPTQILTRLPLNLLRHNLSNRVVLLSFDSHSTPPTYISLISLNRQTPLFVTWIMWNNNDNDNITGSIVAKETQ